MGAEVKLLRTWSSGFALRIVWALKLKGIDEFETIFEDLANKSPLLLESNPVHKKVPVLMHHRKAISESLVILEYIDETWKQTPLLPQDPHERAAARFWAKFGDDKVLQSVLHACCLTEGKEQEEAIAPVMENLQFIEELLKGKKFFGGETIGYLDLALGWIAKYVSVLEEVGGLKLMDAQKVPLLCAWTQNFSNLPIIEENWPSRDKLLVKFQAFRDQKLSTAASK